LDFMLLVQDGEKYLSLFLKKKKLTRQIELEVNSDKTKYILEIRMQDERTV
jgi:hypothetical protein